MPAVQKYSADHQPDTDANLFGVDAASNFRGCVSSNSKMTTRPRIIFINRFFYPDGSATAQILSDLAFALAAADFTVSVVTSRRASTDPAVETIAGVEILRLGGANIHPSNLVGRAIEYLEFYTAAAWLLFFKVRRGDILVAKTDPPLISVLAALVARLRGAKLVNWLQDLYPEVADRLRVPIARGPIGWALRRVRDWALRSARLNVAIGDRMAALLRTKGVPAKQVEVIPNWVNDRQIRPLSTADNWFLKAIARNGEFVVGYSGNLGRAHEFETLVGAARLLAHDEGILFLFIGGGHYISSLKSKVEAEGLAKQFRFLPIQPLAGLKYSLAAANIHWVSLRPELEGLIVPSKFYGILAAGRPTIAIMARDGEIAALVKRYGCGSVIDPGDSIGLASEIVRLKNDPHICLTLGQRARELLESQFTRDTAIKRWTELLRAL
jgi:colanic acid biosynthesis glycosyl transferase WcaI